MGISCPSCSGTAPTICYPLLVSEHGRARPGSRTCVLTCAQVLSSSPPRGSRAALCPAAPTPRGLQPGKGAVAPEPAPRRDKPEVGLWPSTLEPGGDGTTEGSDWSLRAPWPVGMSQGMSPCHRALRGCHLGAGLSPAAPRPALRALCGWDEPWAARGAEPLACPQPGTASPAGFAAGQELPCAPRAAWQDGTPAWWVWEWTAGGTGVEKDVVKAPSHTGLREHHVPLVTGAWRSSDCSEQRNGGLGQGLAALGSAPGCEDGAGAGW